MLVRPELDVRGCRFGVDAVDGPGVAEGQSEGWLRRPTAPRAAFELGGSVLIVLAAFSTETYLRSGGT